MRRIATPQGKIVLRMKVMEKLTIKPDQLPLKQNRENQQKKRSAKGSSSNPFALRIACLGLT